jgi:hypothetical protein
LSPLNIQTGSSLKVRGPCNFVCVSVYVSCRISQSFTVVRQILLVLQAL